MLGGEGDDSLRICECDTLLPMFTRTKTALCAVPLSLLLAFMTVFPVAAATPCAQADELSDAQATLDEASKKLDSLTQEYNGIQQDLTAIDQKIADATVKAQEAQGKMIEGQDELGDTVLAQYKSDGGLSLTTIALSSSTLSDLVKNLSYYSAIQEDQAELIAEQKDLRDQYQQAVDDLDAQRDSQQELLDAAEQKKADAEKVVSEASDKVSSIKESQAALAALQAQAAALAQQQAQEKQPAEEESPNWDTNADRTPSTSNSGSSSSSQGSNSSSTNDAGDVAKGWKSGPASAYGGSTDPSTPNPGTSANGSVVNDSSMGVAIPLSWSNSRSYLGRAVEIRYGGKTVIATVNDLGGMGGGSRHLDLQPGVFKAFGFNSCNAWGVRTVQYRFL